MNRTEFKVNNFFSADTTSSSYTPLLDVDTTTLFDTTQTQGVQHSNNQYVDTHQQPITPYCTDVHDIHCIGSASLSLSTLLPRLIVFDSSIAIYDKRGAVQGNLSITARPYIRADTMRKMSHSNSLKVLGNLTNTIVRSDNIRQSYTIDLSCINLPVNDISDQHNYIYATLYNISDSKHCCTTECIDKLSLTKSQRFTQQLYLSLSNQSTHKYRIIVYGSTQPVNHTDEIHGDVICYSDIESNEFINSSLNQSNLCRAVQSHSESEHNYRYCMLLLQCAVDNHTANTINDTNNVNGDSCVVTNSTAVTVSTAKPRLRQNSMSRHTIDHTTTAHKQFHAINTIKHSTSSIQLTNQSTIGNEMQPLLGKVICIDLQLHYASNLPVKYCRDVHANVKWRYSGKQSITIQQLHSTAEQQSNLFNNCPHFVSSINTIVLPPLDNELINDITTSSKAAITIDINGYGIDKLISPESALHQSYATQFLTLCRQLGLDHTSATNISQRIDQLLSRELENETLHRQISVTETQLSVLQQQHKTLGDYVKQKKQLAAARRSGKDSQ